MKKTLSLLMCTLAVLVLAGINLHAVEEGIKNAKATVRSVHGTVEYSENGAWMPLKVNMKLNPGVTIRTGPDGTADISVNGTASAVRMTNATILQIPTMSFTGSQRDGDTITTLDLKSGSVLGNVKKISANSRYEITTPHGVAGIRGTDFKVEAIPTEDGKFVVTFNSITGVITVSAVINGQLVTHTLTTGTSWEIGETPRKMAAEVIQNYQNQINTLVQATISAANNGGPGPGPNTGTGTGTGNQTGPNNGNGPGNVIPPFNGPPQGPPSSGS
jgi:hypothetical protein